MIHGANFFFSSWKYGIEHACGWKGRDSEEFNPTLQILCFTMTDTIIESSLCVISLLGKRRTMSFKRNVIDVFVKEKGWRCLHSTETIAHTQYPHLIILVKVAISEPELEIFHCNPSMYTCPLLDYLVQKRIAIFKLVTDIYLTCMRYLPFLFAKLHWRVKMNS